MGEQNMVDAGGFLITYREAFNRTEAFENILRYVFSNSQEEVFLGSPSLENSPLLEPKESSETQNKGFFEKKIKIKIKVKIKNNKKKIKKNKR